MFFWLSLFFFFFDNDLELSLFFNEDVFELIEGEFILYDENLELFVI